MRLTEMPVVKVYHGYGRGDEVFVFGHIFSRSPLKRKKFTRNIWTNTLALLRLFMVKVINNAVVQVNTGDTILIKKTEDDGFFRIDWKPKKPLNPGWHAITIELIEIGNTKLSEPISGYGQIFIPHPGQYGCISDIDDTFLISHSSNLRKRLFVLLTENAHSRKPFEGVVRHYQLLSQAGAAPEERNPFFYVSSSEWNLYDYIAEFCEVNGLPPGAFLLNQLKSFSQLWKTGQGKHSTKFMRISRLMETFPDLEFILMGDDSQQDPEIYASVAEHFGKRVKAVYLRHIYKKNLQRVSAAIARIKAAGIPCCHFKHSEDAIQHSVDIGLISAANV